MASILQVLNFIHTRGDDPFDAWKGHTELKTIDIRYDHSSTAAKSIYTPGTLADDKASLDKWLASWPEPPRENQNPSGGLKLLIVYAYRSGDKAWHSLAPAESSRSFLRMAFDRLQLPSAPFAAWYRVSTQVMSFPEEITPSGSSHQTYGLCMGWWTIAWSYDSDEKISRGIVLIPPTYKTPIAMLLGQVMQDLKDFADQPCFLGVAVSAAAIAATSVSVVNINSHATNVANRLRRDAKDLTGAVIADPSEISTEVLSNAAGAYEFRDFLKVLQCFMALLSRQLAGNHDESSNGSTVVRKRAHTLEECLQHLDQTMTSLVALIESTTDIYNMQLAALFNIIAQKDSKVSIEIAVASRALAIENKKDQRISIAIAKASRQIAVESKRDSSSMKTIAAVTMLFLPGTFVASLFATPMFQWNTTGGLRVASQIWIYWATSIPLTLLTLGMWWIWLKFMMGQERAQLRDAEDFDGVTDRPGDLEKTNGQNASTTPTDEADESGTHRNGNEANSQNLKNGMAFEALSE